MKQIKIKYVRKAGMYCLSRGYNTKGVQNLQEWFNDMESAEKRKKELEAL